MSKVRLPSDVSRRQLITGAGAAGLAGLVAATGSTPAAAQMPAGGRPAVTPVKVSKRGVYESVPLRQDNIKRMLAYSSIAPAGYLLLAVTALFVPAASKASDVGGVLTATPLLANERDSTRLRSTRTPVGMNGMPPPTLTGNTSV